MEGTWICRKIEFGSQRSAVHLSPRLCASTLDIKKHIQTYLHERNPESLEDRIIMFSMFNDTGWAKERQHRNLFALRQRCGSGNISSYDTGVSWGVRQKRRFMTPSHSHTHPSHFLVVRASHV